MSCPGSLPNVASGDSSSMNHLPVPRLKLVGPCAQFCVKVALASSVKLGAPVAGSMATSTGWSCRTWMIVRVPWALQMPKPAASAVVWITIWKDDPPSRTRCARVSPA